MTFRDNLKTGNGNDGAQMDLFAIGIGNYHKFLDFNTKFPGVYILFERFAFQLIKAGHKTIGSKMLLERIRWFYATESLDEKGFKINNDFTAYYSRLFMKNHPQYEGIFETRIIRKA